MTMESPDNPLFSFRRLPIPQTHRKPLKLSDGGYPTGSVVNPRLLYQTPLLPAYCASASKKLFDLLTQDPTALRHIV